MAVTLPGVYDLITEFQNAADPALTWRNTMTFASSSTPAAGVGIVAAIGGFMVDMIHSDANVVKFSCYNWARGAQPYPLGVPVFTQTGSVPGGADAAWTHLASPYDPPVGDVVLRVDHIPAGGGKPGRNFFRALLGDEDIDALSGGPPTLVPTVANLQANLNAILTASTLSSYFGSGTGGQRLVVVRYSAVHHTTPASTNISGFNVIGATLNKRTRKNKK